MTRWLCQTAPWTVLLATLMMPSVRAEDAARPMPVQGGAAAAPMGIPQQAGYVHLGAPLYPTPQPNIPISAGATMISSPALAPHEMLYPHTYRAMYPPYYHRVVGSYMWTPFGMRSHEKWQLQGTMVQVKYRSSYPMFTGWHPPTISRGGGPWE